jgi:hypothetical protein
MNQYNLDDLPASQPDFGTVFELARSLELDLKCVYCGELCREHDTDWHILLTDCRRIIHRACQVRMIAGSLAHQQRRCECLGGDEMTRRECHCDRPHL